MGTKEFPDAAPRRMDKKRLAKLVYDAAIAINSFISTKELETETLGVYQVMPDKEGTARFTRPNLRAALFVFQAERRQLPAAQALIKYLWEHGAHKVKLTKDHGDPDREAWEDWALHDIVLTPLFRLWDEYSVRSLCSFGKWQSWQVPDQAVIDMAKICADLEVSGTKKIKIITPFLQLNLDGLDQFELEPGVIIHKWNQEDKAVYLHKYGHYFTFDDVFAPYSTNCYLEIIEDYKEVFKRGDTEEELESFLTFVIGRIKWAIMAATNPLQPFRELLTIAENVHNKAAFLPIRRQSIVRTLSGETRLDKKSCKAAKDLLLNLSTATAIFPDFEDVLWMFDRATLARTSRDELFWSNLHRHLDKWIIHL